MGLTNVEAREMDAEALDFPANRFDAVTFTTGIMRTSNERAPSGRRFGVSCARACWRCRARFWARGLR